MGELDYLQLLEEYFLLFQFYDLEIAQGEWVWENNSGNGDVVNNFVNNGSISFVNDATFTSLFTNNETINITECEIEFTNNFTNNKIIKINKDGNNLFSFLY